ncbi:hypothetical protein FHS29_003628 [Saccharothrix tamanrassetensis]|uniref:Uncharacterized protein n=1 Tax=Saccharothrix tamanrassetensis TaxID=1051531 RepID=A0A841CM03_9PSEU|nr:CU044_5270 family protein [Saccharothrix tamanrassetensis]MBB5957035.1 hypothetical protein [Saccharothrix tamanrassetensis]
MADKLDRLLDDALHLAVADEPAMTDRELAEGRQRLVAALSEPRTATRSKPRRTRWLAAAAAVGVLAAGGVVVQSLDLTGAGTSPTASAADALNRAADLAASVSDEPLSPTQYRYIRSRYRGVTKTVGEDVAWTSGLVNEQWIPADPRQEWMERQQDDGPVDWVPGMEGEGTPPGNPAQRNGEFRAPCGDFSYMAAGQPDKCAAGDWRNPIPEFLAGLPTDPEALYHRLVADGGNGDAGAFSLACGALSSGRLPAEYRARLYRALAHVPGIQVTADRTNLDGAEGIALGARYHDDFTEVIIDPSNGRFIGWRQVVAEDDGSLEKGTVRQLSATTTGVADRIGVAPTR